MKEKTFFVCRILHLPEKLQHLLPSHLSCFSINNLYQLIDNTWWTSRIYMISWRKLIHFTKKKFIQIKTLHTFISNFWEQKKLLTNHQPPCSHPLWHKKKQTISLIKESSFCLIEKVKGDCKLNYTYWHTLFKQ